MSNLRQKPVCWVLEQDVFAANYSEMADAVRRAGHSVIAWQDEWWNSGAWPNLADQAVVFHGSLGNAARIRSELPWHPGAYCDTPAFDCSAWYPRAGQWLLHREWRLLPADNLVADPRSALKPLGSPDRVFVRPNSPLKPFSGRVVRSDQITLAALDHGFYYEDAALPVVITPVRTVTREWRYVVVSRRIVAGSVYEAAGRAAIVGNPRHEAWEFASHIADQLDPPEDVYVMDICEADGELCLLELNPFSGADLYLCNLDDVVAAVSDAAASATAI